MKISIEGFITSIGLKEKDGKISTELLVAQEGEKVQTAVRLKGDKTKDYAPFQVEVFEGRLMSWETRNQGIQHMVMVD